jgi:hypothetical protein
MSIIDMQLLIQNEICESNCGFESLVHDLWLPTPVPLSEL